MNVALFSDKDSWESISTNELADALLSFDGCTGFADYKIEQIKYWLYEMQQSCLEKGWY